MPDSRLGSNKVNGFRILVLLSVLLLPSVLGGGAPLALPRARAVNPLERLALSDTAPRGFTGRVAERLHAGPYTYLRVRTDAGEEHWVASLAGGFAQSNTVTVKVIADAPTFQSRRLSRSFSPLLFGIVRDASHSLSPEPK